MRRTPNLLQAEIDELYAIAARASGAINGATGFISVEHFRAGDEPDYMVFRKGIAFVAGTGIALWIPAKTYTFTQPASGPVGVSMPSNVLIWGSPGARLINAQTLTGHQTNCIFYAVPTAAGNTGVLASNAVLGSKSVSATMPSKPTVGHYLGVANGNGLSQQTFLIQSVTGSASPYTIGLDRPIVLPITAVSSVVAEVLTVPTDIHLEMNGATTSGTGDRIVEFACALRCSVSDWHYDTVAGSLGDIAFSFDVGGYLVGFDSVTVDGTGSTGTMSGLALESCQSGWMNNCSAINTALTGIANYDGIACTLSGCSTSGNGNIGFYWGTDSALGCFDGEMQACTSYADHIGLALDVSKNGRFVGSTFEYATNTGILFNSNNDIAGAEFVACSVDGSATGFVGGSGNTGTRVRGLTMRACSTQCLFSGSDFDGVDLIAVPSTLQSASIVFTGGNVARIRNLFFSGTANCVTFVGVVRGEIDGATFSLGANSIAVQINGGSVGVVRCVRTLGSASGTTGVSVGAGSTLRQDYACDFSSAATAVSNSGSWNRLSIVAAGTGSAQTVAFADLKTTDRITLERSAAGGTAGAGIPLTIPTAGVGWSVTFASTDTGTYLHNVS